MHARALRLSAAAAVGLAALGTSLPCRSQGALKPVDALIVNSESRPVPVADKPLLDAAKAILEATRGSSQTAGRAPYQQSVRGTPACTIDGCTATFAPVPAGKRLVVTHASAAFGVPSGTLGFVILTSSAPQSASLFLPLPQNPAPFGLIASSPVTYYVEEGTTPLVVLAGIGLAFAGNSTVTIVGHLIDAP